jgi:hypothetical protein
VVRIKTIVTVLLLVFIAASVIALFMKGEPEKRDAESAAVSTAGNVEPAGSADGGDTKIIAYYFHGNTRCKTCLTIEMYALEAIETGFPQALKEGRIEFLPVNIETAANEHFIDDFQLAARTVVLERIVGGERRDFVNLDRVWELVGDREAYIRYIQDETEKFMNEGT